VNASRILVSAAIAIGSSSAFAETPPWPIVDDPVLQQLVADALAARPEIKQAEATVRAERELIPQAAALPDPTLSLGIQNDGFEQINIGVMETSFWSIGLSQPFYWPGKRALRGRVASAAAVQAEAAAARARLAAEAEVRRGYVDLLLVRGQLAILGKLEEIWAESEQLARARYEVGQAPQADMLRAQLERTRLRKQRLTLTSGERTRVQALNRLRVRPLDESIETPRALVDLGDPTLPALALALEDAEQRSPELAQARAAAEQSARSLELARRERYPDFAVSAALMPRGGLEPMWSLGLSVNLPVWSGSKQRKAVAESSERREASSQSAESVVQLLRLRTQERLALSDAAVQTVKLYRGGLLVQSEATASSTLAQYQVGRVPFASVLEALGGLLADQGGLLEALAQVQQLAIAQAELSLEAPPGAEGAMASPGSGGSMSSASATGAMSRGGGSAGASGTGGSSGTGGGGAAAAGGARGGGMGGGM
jgi:cobalt-zinc-cadmium efflux system outer membrane protein